MKLITVHMKYWDANTDGAPVQVIDEIPVVIISIDDCLWKDSADNIVSKWADRKLTGKTLSAPPDIAYTVYEIPDQNML